MEFLDHIVCLVGAVIAFLVIVGILIDYLSKSKFKDAIVNFFEEEQVKDTSVSLNL